MGDTRQDSMKKVVVVGAGGHAAEIDDYIQFFNELRTISSNKLKLIGFIDDNPKSYDRYKFNAPFLGNIKEHKVQKNVNYIIAIANIKFRKPIIEFLLNQGAEFLTFIHPSSFVSKSSSIGVGSVIAPNVNIGPNVQIGKYNMINARASIGHDSVIGDYNFITPNVCFSGSTRVGNENMFGINAATIPKIVIGNNNTIAAGMVLDKNVKNDTTVFYRFKERIIAVKS
jgi:sugar O-acyltransferase (sialic acid O-acetyltransferase NeuD family)